MHSFYRKTWNYNGSAFVESIVYDKENQKKAIAQKINGILNENDNGREVYVPMSAKDVRFCFENQLENMPQNTFCLRPSTVQKRKMVSR